jgi:hypothetical protein
MLGLSLHAWENVMLASLGVAAIAAAVVGISTYAVVQLQKQEASEANKDLNEYKIAAGEKVSAANAVGETAKADAAKAHAEIAGANARAREAELKLEQLRQQVAPRTITQAQQNELTAKLSKFKGERGTMIAAPSTPETEMLVRWLAAPLIGAGWDIRILPGSPTATVLFPTGIIVSYPIPASGPTILPRDESPAAAALAKALNEAGLAATALPGLIAPPDTIAVTVSTK